jgi:hypothetical protein
MSLSGARDVVILWCMQAKWQDLISPCNCTKPAGTYKSILFHEFLSCLEFIKKGQDGKSSLHSPPSAGKSLVCRIHGGRSSGSGAGTGALIGGTGTRACVGRTAMPDDDDDSNPEDEEPKEEEVPGPFVVEEESMDLDYMLKNFIGFECADRHQLILLNGVSMLE